MSALKNRIPLLVVGFDFRIASSALREQLVSSPEGRQLLFQAIRQIDESAGLLVLETCNRLEWVVSTRMPEWIAEMLKARMLDRWQQAFPGIGNLPSPYIFTESDAVMHVLRVVVGLESLATGEAQIAGQFQSALKNSQKEKTTSQVINRLGHIAGRIAKSGYKIGFRSNYRQGIHGLVVKYLQNHFKENIHKIRDLRILVAGMGEIGRKTAALVEETLKCHVQPVNRTVTPAHKDKWQPLSQLKELSVDADALVVATGGRTAVIDIQHLALSGREKPLLIMDIGIPRQVAESAHRHPEIHYRNIDHLMELGESKEKDAFITNLDAEIRKEFYQFKRYCQGREMSALLSEIHAGRLDLTQKRIPDFVASRLSDLDEKRRKDIESALKQFIKEYSNNLFQAFHHTMEEFWTTTANGQHNGQS